MLGRWVAWRIVPPSGNPIFPQFLPNSSHKFFIIFINPLKGSKAKPLTHCFIPNLSNNDWTIWWLDNWLISKLHNWPEPNQIFLLLYINSSSQDFIRMTLGSEKYMIYCWAIYYHVWPIAQQRFFCIFPSF